MVDYIFNKLEQEDGIFIVHYDKIFSKSNFKEENTVDSEKLITKDYPENNFKQGNEFAMENSQELTKNNINETSRESSNL